jgi:hypothetical protein
MNLGRRTMATDRANDLLAFKSFIDEQLAGETVPTVDEVLARWARENETDEEREETLEAIHRGLADVEAGRVMPAREAVDSTTGRANGNGATSRERPIADFMEPVEYGWTEAGFEARQALKRYCEETHADY